MAQSKDYNIGPFPFPRGWFVVANGRDITSTKPYNARFFGEDVVLFRGISGKIGMVEAYCPHMGTHLGKSEHSYISKAGLNIQGDGIRCPFHGWRFGLDGKCNHIPYYDGAIPRAAKLKSWHVEERYGIVFCWNDPEGMEPDFDLPVIPEWDDESYVRWEGLYLAYDLPCHPIEVFDNNSDHAHINYVHGSDVIAHDNEIDGVYYRQRESARLFRQDSEGEWARNPGAVAEHKNEHILEVSGSGIVKTVNAYHGVGVNVAYWHDPVAVQIIATTPVEDGSCRLWQGAIMRAPDGIVDGAAREQAALFNEGVNRAFVLEDGEIWSNKRAATTILQLPTDGPFGQARVWYSQFFHPRSEADKIVSRVAGVYPIKGLPRFDEAA